MNQNLIAMADILADVKMELRKLISHKNYSISLGDIVITEIDVGFFDPKRVNGAIFHVVSENPIATSLMPLTAVCCTNDFVIFNSGDEYKVADPAYSSFNVAKDILTHLEQHCNLLVKESGYFISTDLM